MKLSELNFNRYLYKDLGATDEIDSSLLASNLFDENKNKLSSGDTAYDLNSSSLLLNGGVIAPSTITFDKIGSVQADTIIGSIVAEQIDTITAEQITGSITSEQIDTITAEQITGSITSEQIDTITAEQITGSITSEQIDTITAEQITGSITSEQIGSVSAETINGSITADQVGSINASVINGVIVTEQLADNIIDNLSLFAQDLRPIKQVDVLPTLPDTDFPEGATVYLTTDQKLYRNALGAWSSSAAASDITGQLTASQIGSVNSDAITGLILAAQIDTIESNQITGSIQSSQIENIASTKIDGQITSNQIENIASTKIDGQILSSQIENIAVDKIDGQITSDKIVSIAADKIDGQILSSQIDKIAADKIDGQILSSQIDKIAADKIDGQILSSQIDKIAVDKIDGKIIATQISSIDAETITIGLIKNNQIDSVSASKLTAGTIDADVISVINLDASNITSGSLKVGGTSEPSYIELANSTRGTSGKLRWEQGSKIWEDDDGYMGINAIGGELYIYCNNSQIALFKYSGKTQFFGDTSFQATVYLSSGNNTFIWGNDRTNVHIGTSSSGTLIYKRGGTTKAEFGNNLTLQGYLYQPNVNYIELGDYKLTLTANKTAIVPTSRGFNALYCMESPEVWFMDFVKRKNKLDPMFEEVTTPPYHYIKCSGGGYQVWGKRKGHENKRFETKSEAEFLANERFLSMNKVKK